MEIPDGYVVIFGPGQGEKKSAEVRVESKLLVKCRNCAHYRVKDYWGDFGGTPVLAASDQPACMKWGGGDCATSPDGWCFLGERRNGDGSEA